MLAAKYVSAFDLDAGCPIWRNIAIALTETKKGEAKAQTCEIAFHEKAGRSQVKFMVFF